MLNFFALTSDEFAALSRDILQRFLGKPFFSPMVRMTAERIS